MFKLKVTLLYMLLVVLGIAAALFSVSLQKDDARQATAASLQRARLQLLRDMRLHELELQAAAREVASGRVSAYMEALEQFRGQILQLQDELYEAYPPCAADDRRCEARNAPLREAFVRQHTELLDEFTEALARMRERMMGEGVVWSSRSRAEFVSHHREMLVVCSAVSFENCAFRFSYFPLREEMDRLEKRWATRVQIDLALIVDDQGVGLADANDPLWSDIEDFAEKHPLFDAARLSSSARDILLHGRGTPTYHVAVSAPIRYGSQYLGTLLLGTELNEELLHRIAGASGLGVTYIHGEEVLLSTLPERDYRTLLSSFDYAAERELKLETERYIASSIPYLGNASDNAVRVVLSLDVDEAVSHYDAIRNVLLLVGLMLVLLGWAFIQYVFLGYMKPFVAIDAGIHEVISGTPGYQFSFDMPDKLASNMAQSLNLMVAVLRGQPLPEEESLGEAWDERLLIDGELNSGEGDDDELGTVAPAASAAGTERGRELLREPAEAYYRRVHAEFVEAGSRLNKPTDGVTYVRFVEKLAREERQLKARLGCRFVRFEVTVREGQVLLTPIPIP